MAATLISKMMCAGPRAEGKGIHYVDVGTSGGVWGLERGYCMMIGGPKKRCSDSIRSSRRWPREAATFRARRAARNLAARPRTATSTAVPPASGHFVKMVHNGIEYGIMQAYAEGFDIFKNATSKELPEDIRYDLNLPDIAEVWRRGSVVSSWLLDLTAMALTENPTLAEYSGFVQDSGEGRWTIQAAIEEAVPADVLSAALVRAVPFAPGTHVRREDALCHAAEVWRTRGTASASEQETRVTCDSLKIARGLTKVNYGPDRDCARHLRALGKLGDPCVMVIFGAAGDLTRRKLIPALYNLAKGAIAVAGVRGRRRCAHAVF